MRIKIIRLITATIGSSPTIDKRYLQDIGMIRNGKSWDFMNKKGKYCTCACIALVAWRLCFRGLKERNEIIDSVTRRSSRAVQGCCRLWHRGRWLEERRSSRARFSWCWSGISMSALWLETSETWCELTKVALPRNDLMLSSPISCIVLSSSVLKMSMSLEMPSCP